MSQYCYSRLFTIILACFVFTGCSGSRPVYLGQINNELRPCPESPNCVSSQADQEDETHYIAPLTFSPETSPTEAQKSLVSIIESNPQAQIVVKSPEYIYSEYTSDLMGFVDDVEFLIQDTVIHVRSASRLGYRDFDANRERIENLRSELEN